MADMLTVVNLLNKLSVLGLLVFFNICPNTWSTIKPITGNSHCQLVYLSTNGSVSCPF